MNQYSNDIPHHFYGANYAEWKTSDNLVEVIDWFRKPRQGGAAYTIWLVPGHKSSKYEIRWYAPQVEGAIVLGTFVKNKIWMSDEELTA